VSVVYQLHSDVAVVGWSCRLPGAGSISEFWSLLLDGRCAVSRVPENRFLLQRYGHPRRNERGKSYTWSAGVIDDIWGFDPAVFGISPREAEQMDPQQRILLQLAWEALEDAGIRPSSLAGSDTGVFVGASLVEYANSAFGDPALVDAHFGTGNSLAVLANRISHIFDLHGPSLTIDTACSSSLVALHNAVEAIRSGRIDTAIVGGINIIGSHTSFVLFSQASMLSPTGLCRAFDAKADGFVRAEGGAVLVLRKAALANASNNPIHGMILASDVNSAGRTNGIALPSLEAQENLLKRVYSRAAIATSRLAFVEAHGTGTAVGDPIEATAIGRSLGLERATPLPIGSVKTNIGHLEPASGMAGLLKTLLALNHGVLPPSLHFDAPNPHIEFDELNIAVAHQARLLPNVAQQCAGVNSFGFGGTNAHVIVAPGRPPAAAAPPRPARPARYLMLSGATKAALREMAANYAARIDAASPDDLEPIASAAAYRRERLPTRLVAPTGDRATILEALHAYAGDAEHPALTKGMAVGEDLPVAFVYSGNGSQWVGMGVAAYRRNAAFRARFDLIDESFAKLAGWSLREMMVSDALHEKIELTTVAQPLIFAIQSATTAALRASGLSPAAVLGHSVGEIAAAEAAGILDVHSAVRVIFSRSKHQELVGGTGQMAVIMAAPSIAQSMAEEIPDLEVAAVNSPRTITMAGSNEAIATLASVARARGIPFVDLALNYPFHSSRMEPVRTGLIAELSGLTPHDAETPFVSTVTGACLAGSQLNARYWWQNVRQPVQFLAAVREAAKLGARFFVEIGPSPTIIKHIGDSLSGEVTGHASLAVLDRDETNGDPIAVAVAKALVCGARHDDAAVFGSDPGAGVSLPRYPWQQEHFRYTPTPEAVGVVESDRHPLAGARFSKDDLEWRCHLDTALLPALADHKVGDKVILPGTGFIEIALHAASQWLGTENVTLTNIEILKPLDLTGDQTREVVTRISPGSATFEIMSRQRLANVGWIVNCRGKILHGNGGNPRADDIVRDAETHHLADKDELYRIAAASGLCYGPAFQQVARVTGSGEDRVHVDLVPSRETTPFLLDPMRIDCCVQGLITAFPALHAAERGVAYVPTRLDETHLLRAYAVPHSATLRVLRKNERAIVGDCDVFDADGCLIAAFRNVRCQAVPVRRREALESVALVEALTPLTASAAGARRAAASEILGGLAVLGTFVPEETAPETGPQLVEGWATAAAYEIARGLSRRRVVDPAELVATGRLDEALEPWLVSLLRGLEAAGLAAPNDGVWSLAAEPGLPRSEAIVKALAREHPELAAETLLAGDVTRLASHVARVKAIHGNLTSLLTEAAVDFLAVSDPMAAAASAFLGQLFEQRASLLGEKGRDFQILLLGGSASLVAAVARHAPAGRQVTVFEPDARRADRLRMDLSRHSGVSILGAERMGELDRYDLLISTVSLHRLPTGVELGRLLRPNGLLLGIESRPSLFHDLIFGLDAAWFAASTPDYPVGLLRTASEWETALAGAGLQRCQARTIRCGAHIGTFLAGETSASNASVGTAMSPAAIGEVAIFAPAATDARTAALAEDVTQAFIATGTCVRTGSDAHASTSSQPIAIKFLSPNVDGGDVVAAIAAQCLAMKTTVEEIGGNKAAMWLIFQGAGEQDADPVARSLWTFSRTLANEFPHLDMRRINVAAALSSEDAAARIRDLILSGTLETEIHIAADAVYAARVKAAGRAIDTGLRPTAEAVRLERRLSGPQRLQWQAVDRSTPQAGEVEIEIAATGLNFRDLMWMLSLLPDDILEDGFTGPTLGLECAGRVARVGKLVQGLQVGDRVVALAAAAFASHATVAASQVAKLPDGISITAAATIPVAFITAYYALIHQARLRRGEWVLIHGGAGGVGMAAIQVARSRGAKIIATAGSPAKRALLKALGVQHVLDSRSTSFVDGVRQITGDGVDVVLNSLAGEAMEQSIACLRSFGRFVELGKRDYVSNTHLGLRPFRKNLSYFGVDVDQLVGHRDIGAKVFADVMRRFHDGTFAPLPYAVFEAERAAEAFHLMQHSAHIGKLVIRPPSADTVRKPPAPFAVSATGTHLVTGAFGGFGFETVKWLAEKGARHLILIGRRGAARAEARAVVDDLRTRGVQILCDPCDVADEAALARLMAKARETMPPLVGVIHAAMVLDDAIIANLDEERLRRVLEPKIRGADHLDRLSRDSALDYFLLFSSVTTLIGNPGQGNYVAANGYLEGLARQRRAQGLPALAIGWGPIADVGVVARSQKLQSDLEKLTGARAMAAREALDLMAQALTQTRDRSDLSAITIAPNDGIAAGDRLAVLRSPTYAALLRKSDASLAADSAKLDVRALLRSEGADSTRVKLGDMIAAQLARVLHAREEDLSRTRALGEIGLDSLMGLELGMNLEAALDVQMALPGSVGELTIAALADAIIARAIAETQPSAAAVAPIVQRHAGTVPPAQIAALTELAQESPVSRTTRIGS
jgi:acyl transferase domain-containing protein/NADPH:quinone reductase-like Zn-dependent oxidoreductase/short-subunit dehydrogenase/acyl carrier protein